MMPPKCKKIQLTAAIVLHTDSFSSSSIVNSFFLTTLSWLRKLNSAAFFCNLANLFSYLETFLSVGFTLETNLRKKYFQVFIWVCAKVKQSLTSTKKSLFEWLCKIQMGYLQFTTQIVDLSIKIADLVGEKPIKKIPIQIGSISVENSLFWFALDILFSFSI